MAQIVAVTAGKGGTGKSTTSAHIAFSVASFGKKVVIIELDFGLRCIDIMLGVKDIIRHDIGEYLDGKIDIMSAMTKVSSNPNLFLACATKNPFMEINANDVISVCRQLALTFDYVIIDTAGIGSSVFSVIKAADLILMVTTPDTVCVRDSSLLSDFLYIKHCENQRLIINRVGKTFREEDIFYDLDAVMDAVGIPLNGVVPEDKDIRVCGAKGLALPSNGIASKTYNAIARRILGEDVPLVLGA